MNKLIFYFFLILIIVISNCSSESDKDKDKIQVKSKETTKNAQTQDKSTTEGRATPVKEEKGEEFKNVIVNNISGDAKWSMSDKEASTNWKELRENQKIIKNAYIKTGEDSNVTVIFDDDTKIVIDANSKLQISALIDKLNSNASAEGYNLNLEKGKAYSIVNKLAGAKGFQVSSKTSTLGIRGTIFLMEFNPDTYESKVKVEEGTVEVRRNLADLEKTEDTKLKSYYDSITKPILVTKSKKVVLSYKDNEKITQVFNDAILNNQTKDLKSIDNILKVKLDTFNDEDKEEMTNLHLIADPDFQPEEPKIQESKPAIPKKHAKKAINKPKKTINFQSSPDMPIDFEKRPQSDVESIMNK